MSKKENLKIAKIVVLYPFDKVFDYVIPEDMKVEIGSIVKVPFGRKMTNAVVWAFGGSDVDEGKLKLIKEKLDFLPLREELLDFAKWVSEYNLIPLGSVLKMVIGVVGNFGKAQKKFLYGINHFLELPKLTKIQKKLIDFLSKNPNRLFSSKEIKEAIEVSHSTIKSLVNKGLVEERIEKDDCEIQDINEREFNLLNLSDEQSKAFEFIKGKIEGNEHSVVLLEGMTGSGKTEVYFHCVKELLRDYNDSQVLILLPEIALTTQLINRFQKQFGFKPAVWHSQVTSAQKRNIWTGVANGNVRVVIGARSALFLPFKNLSLIIVDEEHDSSFKQSDNGSYNARDMAIVRAKLNNIPIILSSATPSFESLTNAEKEKYHKIHLLSRYGKAVMPDINIIDLKKQKLKRGCYISQPLLQKIEEHLQNEKQVLLFLNRRGYAPITLCTNCGYKITCEHCSCTLTKHKAKQNLMCHYCGHSNVAPKVCPECNVSESLIDFGPGVEKIEEEVYKYFPNARTAILTSDTINTPKKSAEIIEKIVNGEIDIIIGTQLIAKGHHFPNLTLVGILDADASLFGGDIRASERTYQLLTQVSGRAGREADKGLVILQSYTPDNMVLQAIKEGNKDVLIEFEKQSREIAGFPPYGKLAMIFVSGRNELNVMKTVRAFVRKIPHHKDIEILGPTPASVFKVRREFRYKVFIKTSLRVKLQKLIRETLKLVKIPSGIRIKVDVDPYDFG